MFTWPPSVSSASSVVVGEMIKHKKTIECNRKYKKMHNTKECDEIWGNMLPSGSYLCRLCCFYCWRCCYCYDIIPKQYDKSQLFCNGTVVGPIFQCAWGNQAVSFVHFFIEKTNKHGNCLKGFQISWTLSLWKTRGWPAEFYFIFFSFKGGLRRLITEVG